MVEQVKQEDKLNGLDQICRVFGEDFLHSRFDKWEKRVDKDFQDIIWNFLWKGLYSRKVLDPKVRQFCAISALTAIHAPANELKTHIRAAFRTGATDAEVKEVIIQMAPYCGMPYVNDAFRAYEEVAQEQKAKVQS